MPRFVLEIGTEEIPPRFFPPALAQLREEGAQVLQRARLTHGELKVYGTPRRLALIAEDLAARQASATREERGPAASVAYDEEGKPTKAALGFARRHGVARETLEVRETEQGPYVFAVITEPELSAREALAPLLPGLITGISFPKSMRWGEGKLRFGRPIRWLLALVDDEVVEFELDGIHSGRETRGHPVLADGVLEIADAESYEEALRKRHVIVDPDERLNILNHQLLGISHSLGARAAYDDMLGGVPPLSKLLADADRFEGALAMYPKLETTFLVEYPTAACGTFEPAFLRLPEDVLVEEMQHVQSYFPLRDLKGKLLPRFIAVRDGGEANLPAIVAGWESVLRAKLIDADFFYREDRKRPLADRVEDLRGVVFHERLGTMYDKTERIRAIAAEVARQVRMSPERAEHLDRAAYLCKADLVTQMVQELPSLQGAMGREYARKSGESQIMWEGIGQHYRPRFSGDSIPATDIGGRLALADKLDTLTALLAVGVAPTGSADPFGLRREGTGIVRILTEAEHGLRVAPLIDMSLRALEGQGYGEMPHEAVRAGVTDFLRQRLATLLRESGVRHDLIEAALAVGVDDMRAARARAEALDDLHKRRSDFLPTVIACTRPINISKDFEGGEVDPNLFQEDTERELWAAYNKVSDKADKVNLVELFGLFGTELRAPIDRYFEDVLVMAEDEKLRRNRLAMCWQLSQLFRRLADFSL
ncbi:MAG: glycine--tRNA ligase subunit beta, partial [Armatimonadota bacterium]